MSLRTIKTYSTDYQKTGMFTNIVGLSAHNKFGECGTFTLSLGFQADDTFLKIGTIINIEDFYGVVEKITVNSNGYTLNGYTLERMLFNRCHYKNYKYTSMSGLISAFNENKRGLKLNVGIDKDSTKYNEFSSAYEYDGGNFYEEFTNIMKAERWGCKISINPYMANAVVIMYKGRDLSGATNEDCVYFSPDRKNMKDSEIKVDMSNMKDVCYVRGKCLDGSYLVVEVGAVNSPTTREMFLDKTSEGQRAETSTKDKDGGTIYTTPAESLADYKVRLYNYGVEELSKKRVEENASMSVVATGYGDKYVLGDMVRCQDKKIGLDVVMTVKQYDIEIDRNGDNRYIKLGDSKAVGA